MLGLARGRVAGTGLTPSVRRSVWHSGSVRGRRYAARGAPARARDPRRGLDAARQRAVEPGRGAGRDVGLWNTCQRTRPRVSGRAARGRGERRQRAGRRGAVTAGGGRASAGCERTNTSSIKLGRHPLARLAARRGARGVWRVGSPHKASLEGATLEPRAWHAHRPKLFALSRVCVADSNKTHLLAEGDTRVLDVCAAVLRWGTPGGPVDGGGGRQPPLKVRSAADARASRALGLHSLSLLSGKPFKMRCSPAGTTCGAARNTAVRYSSAPPRAPEFCT